MIPLQIKCLSIYFLYVTIFFIFIQCEFLTFEVLSLSRWKSIQVVLDHYLIG